MKLTKIIELAEIVGGGALAGYAHTRFVDANGKFEIPKTGVDALPVLGGALVALGVLEVLGREFDTHVLTLGSGILAGYSFKKMEEIGARAKAKGNVFGQLSGFNPAIGAMTDSEYAQSLRRSGL